MQKSEKTDFFNLAIDKRYIVAYNKFGIEIIQYIVTDFSSHFI